MRAVPITIATNQRDLIRDIRAGKRRLERLHIGIPLHVKKPERRENYVTVSYNVFMDDAATAEVRRVRGLIRDFIRERPREESWSRWEQVAEVLAQHRELLFEIDTYSFADLWSLMLIDWVFQEQPVGYIDGKMELGDAFAAWLGVQIPLDVYDFGLFELVFEQPTFRKTFSRQLLDRKQTNLRLDLRLQVEMHYRELERIEALKKVPGLYQKAGQVMLLVFGLFTGVTEIFVLTLILEAFIGYMQFMADLWEFEEDGIITEEEADQAWFSLFGVFLPFGAYLGKGIALATTILSVGLIGVAVLIAMLKAAFEIADKIFKLVAASQENISTYVEIDPEWAIFIPSDS